MSKPTSPLAPLPNIRIERLSADPTALAVVRPDDNRWQVVIDKDNIPHFYIQVNLDQDGEIIKGILCLDDVLPEGLTVREMMSEGAFGGQLPPEEEAEAMEEYLRNREANPIPCPRLS